MEICWHLWMNSSPKNKNLGYRKGGSTFRRLYGRKTPANGSFSSPTKTYEMTSPRRMLLCFAGHSMCHCTIPDGCIVAVRSSNLNRCNPYLLQSTIKHSSNGAASKAFNPISWLSTAHPRSLWLKYFSFWSRYAAWLSRFRRSHHVVLVHQSVNQ